MWRDLWSFGQRGLWDQAGGIYPGASWNDSDRVTDTEKEQPSLLLLYSEKKKKKGTNFMILSFNPYEK